MQHEIVQYRNSAVSKSATSSSATLKDAISNSKTLNQCNIEKVQHLIVKYYDGTILNSAKITIAITTSATATSAIWKSRTLK